MWTEKRLSLAVFALQTVGGLTALCAFWLPILVVPAALLLYAAYLVSGRRDSLKDARLQAELKAEITKDDGKVTINGKPVTY
jgi:hypothetical protein